MHWSKDTLGRIVCNTLEEVVILESPPSARVQGRNPSSARLLEAILS
ncbi:MAG: hypothetical protein QXU11_10600 [Thermoproteota archaeon]